MTAGGASIDAGTARGSERGAVMPVLFVGIHLEGWRCSGAASWGPRTMASNPPNTSTLKISERVVTPKPYEAPSPVRRK